MNDINGKRRHMLGGAAALPLAMLATGPAQAAPEGKGGSARMTTSFVRTKDGVDIFFKDWGSGTPIVFSHGWPLSSDDWDSQMMYFVQRGFRVIAHDRRGHGRSTQVGSGHDMDHYADDLAAVVEHLDL